MAIHIGRSTVTHNVEETKRQYSASVREFIIKADEYCDDMAEIKRAAEFSAPCTAPLPDGWFQLWAIKVFAFIIALGFGILLTWLATNSR